MSSATMSGTRPVSPTPQSPIVRFEPEASWCALHRACFHAEAERAAVFELELAVDARLLDVGVLLLVADAQDLRTEARRIERVVAVAAGARVRGHAGREQRTRRDRQTAIELERLRPEVRAYPSGATASAGLRSSIPVLGTLPARLNAVWLPPVIPSSGWLPARELWKSKPRLKFSATSQFALKPIEFRSFLLLAMLLLVAEVLAGAGELVDAESASQLRCPVSNTSGRSRCAAARWSARRGLPSVR